MQMPRAAYDGKFEVELVLHELAEKFVLSRKVEFIGPDPKLLREDTP